MHLLRWDRSPQAPGVGRWERLPGVKWPRAGLVSRSTSPSHSGCTVGCPDARLGGRSDSQDGSEKLRLRRGKLIPSAKASAQHVLAVQYIFLEGMNGSVVLLNPGGLTLGLVCV